MRAISLHQPWATLVARGIKRYETRHWRTHFRGPLAIHAARRWGREQRDLARSFGIVEFHLVPLGAVIAVCNLTDCVPSNEVPEGERVYGIFAPGRFAW